MSQFLPVLVSVRSKAICSAAGESGPGDRPERAGDINAGSVEQYTFPERIWTASQSRHPCISFRNKETVKGPSGAATPLPSPAVSGHFPATPHPNGPAWRGQEEDNEAILLRASMPLFLKLLKLKKKKKLYCCWLGKLFCCLQLIISPINSYCCLRATDSSVGKGEESCTAPLNRQMGFQYFGFHRPQTSNLNTRTWIVTKK